MAALMPQEPGGLAPGPDGRTLLIADTNNNAIRVLDAETGRLSTLELSGVPPPRVAPGAVPATSADGPPAGAKVGPVG